MHPLKLLSFFVVLTSAILSSGLSAENFEGIGVIDEINPSNNLIIVGEETFKLPNTVLFEGSSVINQIKPGNQIGFSGDEASPHPVITSVYIYPDSVSNVQTSREP